MNPSHFRSLCSAVVVCIATGGLVACVAHDAPSYIASARSYITKADYKAAVIELKNAVQKEPNSAEARYLLAKSLLAIGDAAGAEAEVRKAMANHAAENDTWPLLARAMAAQGRFEPIITELGQRKLDDPQARSDLEVSLAGAYLARRDINSARREADAAIVDQPGNVRGLLLQARLAALGGDMKGARDRVDEAFRNSPDDLDTLLRKAELAVSDGSVDDAKKLLARATAVHPKSMVARAAAFSLALKSRDFDGAKAQLAEMKEIQPNDLRASYAEAVLAEAQGDNAHAREAIQRVLGKMPQHLPSLMLDGLIEFKLRSYASAEDALQKVLAKLPDEPTAGRVLALVYLRTGRAAQAVDMLTRILEHHPDDPVLLRTAGEAYLAVGNTTLAADAYERVNAIDKTNVGSKIRLAQVRLAAGDTTRGFSDLESLAANESTQYQAELALYSEHMRRREYDRALSAVDALEKKQPNSVLVPALRGGAYLAKRDLVKARANFTKALELQPDYFPAAQSLAVIDLQEGNVQAAQERYQRMLAKNPKNEQILLAQAELLTLSGGPQESIKDAIDKAIAASPTSPRARLALIAYDMRRRDAKAAIAAAQAALSAIPNNAQLTEALGASQLAGNEPNQAIETFKSLVQLQPQNPLVLLRLAEAQVAIKDYAGAIENERKALVLKPDLPQALVGLAKTYLLSGHPESAIDEARRLQKQQPGKAAGYALEGELFRVQKKWPEATTAFASAMSREPSPLLATRYYATLLASGKSAEAAKVSNQWMQQHPKDPTFPLLLAGQAQAKKDFAAAISGYRKVLEIDPDNIVALNNLAWSLAESNDPTAREYAERAHRLAPFNPGVLDTLGWTLARTGDAKRGTQLLLMASRLAPAQADIRLHLAKALAESGDKAGARREIAELTKLDKSSPIRIEAEKLSATL
jgi:putative PEP-CTERM system TPR-repeat lipoprotein